MESEVPGAGGAPARERCSRTVPGSPQNRGRKTCLVELGDGALDLVGSAFGVNEVCAHHGVEEVGHALVVDIG